MCVHFYLVIGYAYELKGNSSLIKVVRVRYFRVISRQKSYVDWRVI